MQKPRVYSDMYAQDMGPNRPSQDMCLQKRSVRTVRARQLSVAPNHMLLALCLVLMSLSTVLVSAQDVGIDICACQPGEYRFQLQLDLTCDDSTIDADTDEGVSDTTCLIGGQNPQGDEEVNDYVPISIQEFQVLELDQNQDVLRSKVYGDGYKDGDTIDYVSFVVERPENVTAQTLPAVLAITITGKNEAGQALLNTLGIRFENDCGIHPVLTDGQQIGWVRFVSRATFGLILFQSPLITNIPSLAATNCQENLVDPPTALCPLAPSDAPTPLPTALPGSPTEAPVVPTNSPTLAPAVPGTTPPVEVVDTEEPTIAPVVSPTSPPFPPTEGNLPTSTPSCSPVVPGQESGGGSSAGGKKYRNKKSMGTTNRSKLTKSSVDDGSSDMKPRPPGPKRKKKTNPSRGKKEMNKVKKRERRRLMVGPRPPTPSPVECPE